MSKSGLFGGVFKSLIMFIFAALALSGANTASADVIVTVTYTGKVTSMLDPTGLFGSPSDGLTGASVTDVFKFDLNKGEINHYDFGGVPETQLLGGYFYGLPTPVISSVMTIDGHSVAFGGNATGQYDNQQGLLSNSVAENVDVSGIYYINSVYMPVNAPLSLSQPYSGAATRMDAYAGYVNICKYTLVSPDQLDCFAADETLDGYLKLDAVTATVSSGVPQPASWLLMLVGFAGVGGALRRQASRLVPLTV